jgi:hypothetical protein
MKRTLLTTIIFGVFILNSFAQSNPKQIKVGEQFISLLQNQEYEKCWALIDKKINSGLNKEQFIASVKQIYGAMPDKKGEFELYMQGVKFMNGQELSFYSFKYKNDIAKPAPLYLIDLIFAGNKATLIAGVQPKASTIGKLDHASSSKGEETIISGNSRWLIDSVEFRIIGVNVVHFTGKTGIVAVQVEQVIPDNVDTKAWAYQQGIMFAKYLYRDDLYKTAINKAAELDIELLPKIGVSFINTKSGQGYNTMINSEDYQ